MAIPSAQDPSSVRDAARAILSQSEFQTEPHGFWQMTYHYLIHPQDLVGKGLEWLLRHLPWNARGAAIGAWLAVMLAFALVAFFVMRLARSTVRDSGTSLGGFAIPATQTADELFALAEDAEAKQQWQLSIRFRYAAIVSQLADEGLVKRQPGRTAGEYAQDITKNAPQLSDKFRAMTAAFEVAWYGRAAVGKPEAGEFRALAGEFSARAVA
jgi:hypothetical protein